MICAKTKLINCCQIHIHLFLNVILEPLTGYPTLKKLCKTFKKQHSIILQKFHHGHVIPMSLGWKWKCIS